MVKSGLERGSGRCYDPGMTTADDRRVSLKWNNRLAGGFGILRVYDGDGLTYDRRLTAADVDGLLALLAEDCPRPPGGPRPVPAMADVGGDE